MMAGMKPSFPAIRRKRSSANLLRGPKARLNKPPFDASRFKRKGPEVVASTGPSDRHIATTRNTELAAINLGVQKQPPVENTPVEEQVAKLQQPPEPKVEKAKQAQKSKRASSSRKGR